MIKVLNDRTKRVGLKGKQFQVANPAWNDEVEKAEDVVTGQRFETEQRFS